MKKFAKLFLAVAALFAGVACTTDTTEDLGVNPVGQTTLTLSLEESRTQLGEKADGLYPLVWSEGDQIAVNGVTSTALTAEQAGAAGALFTFESTLTRPYSIVYPAPAEGVVALTEGQYPVVFPATQAYTAGTFASGTAPMYGYAAADTEGAIQMNHLTGVLRLAVKGEGVVLKSLTVSTESGAIAGTYDVDCATGTLTAHDDASNTVKVSFEGGLALGAEATPIYVAVPAGTYGKFTLLLTSTTDIMRLSFDSTAKPIAAGTVREFAEFAYEANAEESEVFIIDSKEALIQFAQIAANFAPYTTAKVTAPIDMTGVEWTPVQEFGAYIFDGGEFEIKGLTAPLFNTTAATIKNVKLTDVAIEVTDLAKSGSIVCELYGGALVNCSAAGSLHVNNTTLAPESYSNLYDDIAHGGLAGYVSNATVYNCTNDVDVTVTSFCEASIKIKSCVGGVIGGCANLSSFDTLVNNGDVKYIGTTQAQNIYMSGVIGKENSASGEKAFAALSNCTNNGELSTSKESICGNSVLISGITGAIPKTSDFVCDKLENHGAITHNGKCGGITLAGIAGYNIVSSFTNCKNTNSISVADGATVTSIVMSGLFAGSLTADQIKSCTNSGDITLGANATGGTSASLSGIAGSAVTVGSITDCSNSGDIKIADKAVFTSADMSGIFAKVSDVYINEAMSNCDNSGAISIGDNITTVTGKVSMSGVANFISTKNATSAVTITGCDNRGPISIGNVTHKTTSESNGTRLQIGGVFFSICAGNYSNCNNEVAGTITVKTNTWTSRHQIGGLIGYVGQTGTVANQIIKVSDCENKAAMTITPVGKTQSSQIGGLTGECYAAATDDVDQVLFERVHNSGAITVGGEYGTSGYPRLGGLLGICNMPVFELKECVNSGTITLETTGAGQKKVGGIVGADTNKGEFKITNCENKGDIKVTTVVASLRVGGILASKDNTNPTIISGAKNTGNFTFVDQTATGNSYAIGGIIGYSNRTGLTLSGCINGDATDATKGAITLAKAPGGSGIAGIAGYLSEAHTITSCINYGTIKQQGDSATPRLGGIVGYHTAKNLTLDKCENHGTIANEGIVSAVLSLGGLVGSYEPTTTLTVKDSKNTGSVTCSGEQTTATADTYVYRLGGIVGNSVGTVLISGCTNGVADDATKGIVTIGAGPTGVAVGGIAGLTATTTTISTSKNYGNISQTGKGSYSKTIRSHIAGILALGNGGNITITDCENYGMVEYGTVKPNNRVDVAGITATTIATGTNSISGCKNGGTIKFGAETGAEICVAGIIGCPQGTTLIENCENLANGLIWSDGKASTNHELGGIAGGPSGASSEIISCINRGTIKQTRACSSTVSAGGIVGYAYSIGLVDKCDNYGTIEILAQNTGSVNAGGIVGYLRQTTKKSDTNVSNCVNRAALTFTGNGANYRAAGVIGYATTDADAPNTLIISNVTNLGNLTFDCTYTTPYLGGVVGNLVSSTISDSQSYCDILAIGKTSVGAFSGTVRSETALVTNCKIGGNIAFETKTSEDADGNETVAPDWIKIDDTNFFTYIYGGATDWTGVENYDGCSVLTTAPEI